MYSLSIFFGPSPMPAQFLFKDKENAGTAYINVMRIGDELDNTFRIEDDFGQLGVFIRKTIHAAVLENMDLGEESRIQRGLSQARGQAKANERARTDPTLRAAMSNAQGPSVISPFNGRGF